METKTPTLTVITPTYNRAHLLPQCFESLMAQTCFDFEWILVDDGSTDHTIEAAKQFERAPFAFTFVTKENGGKHTALNAAHPYVHGKYVLMLDSDDTLTPEAVETALDGWARYENDTSVAMVTFLKRNSNGEICAYAKDEHIPTDFLCYKRVCVASSDCCEVIRAELFLKYPFPVYDGERFLAETALWFRAGLDGSCIYINKVIYCCEYLEGGLSQSGRRMRVRNCNGGMYTSWLRMNRRCPFFDRVKAGLLYICYGRFAKKAVAELYAEGKPYGGMVTLCMVPGTVMYWVWKRKYAE